MQLTIMSPTSILDQVQVQKVSARGGEGSFTLLPGHADILSRLKRSIVTAVEENGLVHVWGADGGVLTKQGDEVLISSPLVVRGEEEEGEDVEASLTRAIDEALQRLRRESKSLQTESLRMESDLVRRLLELGGEL